MKGIKHENRCKSDWKRYIHIAQKPDNGRKYFPETKVFSYLSINKNYEGFCYEN